MILFLLFINIFCKCILFYLSLSFSSKSGLGGTSSSHFKLLIDNLYKNRNGNATFSAGVKSMEILIPVLMTDSDKLSYQVRLKLTFMVWRFSMEWNWNVQIRRLACSLLCYILSYHFTLTVEFVLVNWTIASVKRDSLLLVVFHIVIYFIKVRDYVFTNVIYCHLSYDTWT